ncbi:hypothetical protein AX14_004843, partial [Amanita brunnescens Koide BX004]
TIINAYKWRRARERPSEPAQQLLKETVQRRQGAREQAAGHPNEAKPKQSGRGLDTVCDLSNRRHPLTQGLWARRRAALAPLHVNHRRLVPSCEDFLPAARRRAEERVSYSTLPRNIHQLEDDGKRPGTGRIDIHQLPHVIVGSAWQNSQYRQREDAQHRLNTDDTFFTSFKNDSCTRRLVPTELRAHSLKGLSLLRTGRRDYMQRGGCYGTRPSIYNHARWLWAVGSPSKRFPPIQGMFI